MPQIWADVTLGKLQTESRLDVGYQGDTLIRIRSNMKYNCFTAFNVLISNFLVLKKPVELEVLRILYLECLEFLHKMPTARNGKGKLTYYISKIGLEAIMEDKDHFCKYVLAINQHVQQVLYTPRSLKSSHLTKYQQLQFKVVISEVNKTRGIQPKAYIGVGYRDKGHSRNVAQNGELSWQEMAQVEIAIVPTDKDLILIRDHHLRLITNHSWVEMKARSDRRLRKMKRQAHSLLD